MNGGLGRLEQLRDLARPPPEDLHEEHGRPLFGGQQLERGDERERHALAAIDGWPLDVAHRVHLHDVKLDQVRKETRQRRETPAQCAVRYRRMLEALAPIDPAFGRWMFAGPEKGTPLDRVRGDGLTRLIADCVTRADDGDPEPVFGYRFGAYTGSKAALLDISIHAGEYAPPVDYMANTASLLTAPLSAANAALITLPVFKSAMLAIAAAWDATWCAAYPWSIIPLWPKPGPGQPLFRMAWMSYLSARFAPLVVPPSRSLPPPQAEGTATARSPSSAGMVAGAAVHGARKPR